ncbi:hypothetical protein GCM10020008_05870 [Lentilactobacillus kefiri DSM 20587 = JCM 5818]|uniref:Uncharacterized protein n=1 Tax=Lentilactobacillus kefiri TaxID=33962 RepID=A0A511DTJ9_LENKE|nr:hypothetical protein LKE01_04270 [Lentilactobacillus kefiri]
MGWIQFGSTPNTKPIRPKPVQPMKLTNYYDLNQLWLNPPFNQPGFVPADFCLFKCQLFLHNILHVINI